MLVALGFGWRLCIHIIKKSFRYYTQNKTLVGLSCLLIAISDTPSVSKLYSTFKKLRILRNSNVDKKIPFVSKFIAFIEYGMWNRVDLENIN